MTQRPVTDLAIPQTKDAMLDKVKEAEALGLWPQKMSADQAQVLAYVAAAYGLDPFMGEIMPFQGRPFITIAGRRRKDEEAGHFASINHRPLTAEEKEWYTEADVITPGDLCGMTVLRDERGNTVEAFWKVTKAEREARTDRGGLRSPVVAANPIEMGQKRGERRAREIAWGPITLPKGLAPTLRPMEEGDIIEGEARAVTGPAAVTAPPKPKPVAPNSDSKPKLGKCEEHIKPWAPGEGGRIGHPILGGGWHWKDEVVTDAEGNVNVAAAMESGASIAVGTVTTEAELLSTATNLDLRYMKDYIEINILGKSFEQFLGENNDYNDIWEAVKVHHAGWR